MTTIPNGLPSLARGEHQSDEGKACVMEYVSVITGCRFSDQPDSTYAPIALAAQVLNDALANHDRHMLVPFISRLAAARPPVGWQEVIAAEQWMNRFDPNADQRIDNEYALWDYMKDVVGWAFVDEDRLDWTNRDWQSDPSGDPPMVGPRLVFKYDPDAALRFLDHILTTYEQAMGITPEPIPTEALAKARALIETRMVGV